MSNSGSGDHNLQRVIERYNVNPSDPLPISLPDTDRNKLAELFNWLGYRVGAEVGVGGGLYSEILCKRIPGVKLYAVDAWVPYPGYPDFMDQLVLDADKEKAIALLQPYDVTIIQKMSYFAVMDIPDNSLDFVYIDANHTSPWIDEDIREWSRKVRSGGIVSGHDYHVEHDNVIEAVKNYTTKKRIKPWFIVGVTTSGVYPDLIPSWFWVKP